MLLMTNIEEVSNNAINVRFMVVLNILPNCMAPLLRGVIRPIGRQPEILIPHIISQLIMSTPLLWLFGFYFDLGLNGIWIGTTCVVTMLLAFYTRIILSVDWHEVALETYKRENPNQSLRKKD
jgi:Na+-driven multidrug efflux pump